jgi:hypothetical protein
MPWRHLWTALYGIRKRSQIKDKSECTTQNWSSINDVTVLGRGGQGFCDNSTKASVIKIVEGKFLVTKQNKASKAFFFLLNLKFQSNLGLKISHQKIKKCHTGWGVEVGLKKCQKSVTCYLNGPLIGIYGTELSLINIAPPLSRSLLTRPLQILKKSLKRK